MCVSLLLRPDLTPTHVAELEVSEASRGATDKVPPRRHAHRLYLGGTMRALLCRSNWQIRQIHFKQRPLLEKDAHLARKR